jgi:hypothetical protein
MPHAATVQLGLTALSEWWIGQLRSQIARKHLHPTEGYGSAPHCTICYGLPDGQRAALLELCYGYGPVEYTLTNTLRLFDTHPDYTVLLVPIVSEDLHALHTLIRKAFHVKSKFPSYLPHVTVAYLQKKTYETFPIAMSPVTDISTVIDYIETTGETSRLHLR